MKRTCVLILLSTAFLCMSAANANPASAKRCDNCTNQQKKAVAVDMGIGYHYIYDLTNATINRYMVTREDLIPGQWVYMAHGAAVEAGAQTYFDALVDFYNFNNHSLNASYSVPYENFTSEVINAYDAMDDGQNRSAVINHLNNNWYSAGLAGVYNVVRVFYLQPWISVALPLTFQVEYPDGSKQTYKWNPDTQSYEYLPDSSYDSHGNKIPDTRSDITDGPDGRRNYSFVGGGNPSDVTNWANRLGMWDGVTITSGSFGWACTSSAGGVHCVPF